MTDRRQANATPEQIARTKLAGLEFRPNDNVSAIERAMLAQLQEKYGEQATQAVPPTEEPAEPQQPTEPTPATPQPEATTELTPEQTSALENYKQQYETRGGNSWESVRTKLLTVKEGKTQLERAMALKSAVIFQVDANGDVLFSDGETDVMHPKTIGMNCKDANNTVKTAGYELFDERQMRAWQTATDNNHFVKGFWSWIDYECVACFSSLYGEVDVAVLFDPAVGDPRRGARRLLRV